MAAIRRESGGILNPNAFRQSPSLNGIDPTSSAGAPWNALARKNAGIKIARLNDCV